MIDNTWDVKLQSFGHQVQIVSKMGTLNVDVFEMSQSSADYEGLDDFISESTIAKRSIVIYLRRMLAHKTRIAHLMSHNLTQASI